MLFCTQCNAETPQEDAFWCNGNPFCYPCYSYLSTYPYDCVAACPQGCEVHEWLEFGQWEIDEEDEAYQCHVDDYEWPWEPTDDSGEW